jgi:hypothetical protein
LRSGARIPKRNHLSVRRLVIVAAPAAAALLCAAGLSLRGVSAQKGGLFLGSADDPAIQYSTTTPRNLVDDLNRRLQDGSARLTFEGRSGYLRSALEALNLPVDSQLLVYSQGSLQGRLVGESNPRAIFFGDRVALAWVRDGDLLEAAAHDDRSGIVFYTLEQRAADRPVFKREFRCLGCHMTGETSGIPGLLMFSSRPDASGDRHMIIEPTDHNTPYQQRFGGWFVTGAAAGAMSHLGNRVAALDGRPGDVSSVDGLFGPDGYRAATSDVAALLTFSHQVHMTNLLTRASWEARAADPDLHPGASGQIAAVEALMRGIASELVDYMLFVDEPPLPATVAGKSGFAERMSATGPRDRRGRSLYQLDLTRRLMKYPCSYLIYSPAFDALPPLAKSSIYERMWTVLSGEAADSRYRSLSLGDRQAIVEILRDTKPDLPAYFTGVRP